MNIMWFLTIQNHAVAAYASYVKYKRVKGEDTVAVHMRVRVDGWKYGRGMFCISPKTDCQMDAQTQIV